MTHARQAVSRETRMGDPSAPMAAPSGAPRKCLVLLCISSFGSKGEGYLIVIADENYIELGSVGAPAPRAPSAHVRIPEVPFFGAIYHTHCRERAA